MKSYSVKSKFNKEERFKLEYCNVFNFFKKMLGPGTYDLTIDWETN